MSEEIQLTPKGLEKARQFLADYISSMTDEHFAEVTGGRPPGGGLTNKQWLTVAFIMGSMTLEIETQVSANQKLDEIVRAMCRPG